jgi:hypothetical protein
LTRASIFVGSVLAERIDCRVKPGNDAPEGGSQGRSGKIN